VSSTIGPIESSPPKPHLPSLPLSSVPVSLSHTNPQSSSSFPSPSDASPLRSSEPHSHPTPLTDSESTSSSRPTAPSGLFQFGVKKSKPVSSHENVRFVDARPKILDSVDTPRQSRRHVNGTGTGTGTVLFETATGSDDDPHSHPFHLRKPHPSSSSSSSSLCSSFPSSASSECECPRWCPSIFLNCWPSVWSRILSFQFLFIMVSIIQVVVACTLVWYLGWRNSGNIVSSLSYQIRVGITEGVQTKIVSLMTEPLIVVDALAELVPRTFPNVGNLTTVRETTGYLADVVGLQYRHRNITSMGFSTIKKLVVATNNFGPQILFAVGELNLTTGIVYVHYHNPWNSTTNITDPRFGVSDPPFNYAVPTASTDSPETIDAFLGPTTRLIPNYNPITTTLWKAAVAPGAKGRSVCAGLTMIFGWTPPIAAVQTSRAHYDHHDQVDFVTWNTLGLAHFDDLLKGLNVGTNGMAFIVQQDGIIVSTTVPLPHGDQDRGSMWNSNSPLIEKLAEHLGAAGLIRQNITHLLASLPYGTDVLNSPSSIYDGALSVDGASYHIQARSLYQTSIRLNWVIVIVYDDSDFDWGISQLTRYTTYLSVGVVIICVAVAAIITTLISRPLQRVVAFMQQAVKAIQMERGNKQRNELRNLVQKWNEYTHSKSTPTSRSKPNLYNSETDTDQNSTHSDVPIADDPFTTSHPRRHSRSNRSIQSHIDHLKNGHENGFHRNGGSSIGGDEDDDDSDSCTSTICSAVTRWNDRFGGNLREIRLMQSAFGSMLHSLAVHDHLEAINEAKRHFIR